MKNKYFFAAVIISVLSGAFDSWAGPPFITDDPEPVELHHWEFYAASAYSNGGGATAGTAPHVEINYGAARETQVHLIVPLAYAGSAGRPLRYGPGDIELGVKRRFVRETTYWPQAGIFPLVELPSGDSSEGLGSGHTAAFLPAWLQKSIGPWTSYAGGGYWFNKTAAGDRDYWQSGWEVQRDLSKVLTLGGEVFSFSSKTEGGQGETGFNAGAMINFSEEHHLLLSAGGDTAGPNSHFAYAAFQWTLAGEPARK